MSIEGERIAVLETKYQVMEEKLDKIAEQLNSLLELKAKGIGAIGLVSLILGSGIIGIVTMAINYFKGGGTHLG